ncbi:MAG: DUF3598 family protein [Cyanophyceae cyanobacterium]
MASQWDYLLKNVGEWQGSFTRFSPQGEHLEDTPTVVILEGRDNNRSMHQVVRRLPPGQSPQEKVFDYSSLSKGVMFMENGAFSQGSMQWGPYSEFGAELGLVEGDRRLRLVQLYNKGQQLERLTLIREQLAGTNTPERPPLTVEQLEGEWRGVAVTQYADLRPADTYSTHLKIYCQGNQVTQQLTWGDRTLTSTAQISGSVLKFDQSDFPIQIVLLPDGASSNCPVVIKPGHRFVLEVGWLVQPNQRQRLVRRYSDRGEWVSLTLVKEEKV